MDRLLGLVVDGVLSAEGAILIQLQTIRGILLVLHGIVVSLLALRASQGDLHPCAGFRHIQAPPCNYSIGHKKRTSMVPEIGVSSEIQHKTAQLYSERSVKKGFGRNAASLI